MPVSIERLRYALPGHAAVQYARTMGSWDLLADLEVQIDGYTIEHHSRQVKPGWERITTTYVLQSDGAEGRGEDITKWPPVAQAVIDRGPHHPLAGTFTLGEFSEHLSTLDLFPDVGPEFADEDPVNRRWGFEFKRTVAPRLTRSMHIALTNLRLERLDVVHAGDQTFPLADTVRAVALRRLFDDLAPLP